MIDRDRIVWLRAARAIEVIHGAGAAVWAEPAAVRRSLADLLGVFPATHVQIDLEAFAAPGGPARSLGELLDRSGAMGASLAELFLALDDAVRPPLVWGLGLPSPGRLAAALGDPSERGAVKAGMRLASFLQAARERAVGFAAVDHAAGEERAASPVLRNAGLYGWKRALCVDTLDALGTVADVDAWLVNEVSVAELRPLWESGRTVGGGLDSRFWAGEDLGPPPRTYFLFGAVPGSVSAEGIVVAGRRLRAFGDAG